MKTTRSTTPKARLAKARKPATSTAKPAQGETSRKSILLALIALVLLGGAFRFYNLNWDHYHSFHPDERNILGQTAGIQATDGYRVKFFAYGQLPVYLYRSTASVLSVPRFLAPSSVGGGVQAFWWVFLALLFGGIGWLLSRERWWGASLAVSGTLFATLTLGFYFPSLFNIWAANLYDYGLAIAGLIFLPASVLVSMFAVGQVLELKTRSLPWGKATGISLGLAAVLAVLAVGLPGNSIAATVGRSLVQLTFTTLLLVLGLWFAWVSRWGRVVIGLISLWGLLAYLPTGYPNFVDYRYEMVIGRGWAAFFSTLTIVAVYALVKRLYKNAGMALLAAAAFALSVISIQVSHYCITESLITLMGVVMALAAWEIAEEGSWRAYLVAGAAFGVALAAKSSSLYYVVMIVGSHLLWLAKRPEASWRLADKKTRGTQRLLHSLGAVALLVGCFGAFAAVGWKFKGVFSDLYQRDPGTGFALWVVLFTLLLGVGAVLLMWGLKSFEVLRAQVPAWIPLTVTGALAFFLFCLLSPWSLLARDEFMASMNYEWNVVSHADACYVYQFKDTPRYLFQLWNLMQVNLWWPLGVTAVLGMFWVYFRFFRGWKPAASGEGCLPVPFAPGKSFTFHPADFVLLLWFTAYFGFIGMWNTKFIRYMVPLIPFFCVFAARLLWDLFGLLKGTGGRAVRAALLAVVLGGSLFYSAAYMAVYRNPHPWIEASVWIVKNIPFQSFILNEEWDDGLPTGVDPTTDPRVDKSYGPQNYRQENVRVYETFGMPTDDNPIKKQAYVDQLTKADYLTISSKKLWYTITNSTPEFKPNGFNVFPVSSRYYRLLWTGQLGYKMVGDFHNFPRLFGWSHPDDMAEESFSVYDHPRAYVFKKVETVSPERMRALLSSDDYVKGVNRDMMLGVTPQNVDAFIEAQHRRLEASGALQRLDAQMAALSPTPTPVPAHRREARRPAEERVAPSMPTPVPTADTRPVEAPPGVPGVPSAATLKALDELAKSPVIEGDIPNETVFPRETSSYQARAWITWWLLLVALGFLALPLAARLLPGLMPGAYSLSKMMGLLLFTWVVWLLGNVGFSFTLPHCWVLLVLCLAASLFAARRWREALARAYRDHAKSWWMQEGLFLLLFAAFTFIRMNNPHVHDPSGEGYSGGGEAGMDMGFLSSVVRATTFPPQNMWMAGEPIGYSFYFGHLMMGVLTKTLGLAPEVTYNLAVATLFALIFTGAFGIAYGLSGRLRGGLVAGFLCAVAGNLSGAFQEMRVLLEGLRQGTLAPFQTHVFDFWGPSRVIPNSINEFPFFSVLFADLHAHTLAMPFAMLFIALAASLYLAPTSNAFDLKRQAPSLLLTAALGFVFGSLGFLNTWELPVWAALFFLTLSARNLGLLKEKPLREGFKILLGALAVVGLALGFLSLAARGTNPLALGGRTVRFAALAALAWVVAWVWMNSKKETRAFSGRLLELGMFGALFLVVAFAAWVPYFTGFVPQQSEVLWVTPNLRTELPRFWTIYAAFLSVIALGFLVVYEREVFAWISKVAPARRKRGGAADRFVEGTWNALESLRALLVRPQGPVRGMLALGLGLWALVIGASWVHFADPQRQWLAVLMAAVTFACLVAAVLLEDSIPAWGAFAGAVLTWFLLGAAGVMKFRDAESPFLGLWLFTALFLAAFLQLGWAIRVRKEAKLSFTFLLAGLFFLILAGLEVFVMKEYLGGEWMRNNSLFKFGICAWTLGSVAAGVLIVRLWDLFKAWVKVKRESPLARGVLTAAAYLFVFLAVQLLFWESDSLIAVGNNLPITKVFFALNLLMGLALIVWGVVVAGVPAPWAAGLGTPWAFLLLLPFLSGALTAGWLASAVNRVADFDLAFLFPAQVAAWILVAFHSAWKGRPDLGRRLGVGAWKALLCVLLALVTVYPVAGSWRKCHGFFDSIRESRIGYKESATLNGETFIRRTNRYDAAAIRFLNDRVPGQPCLVEAVGLGYNTWGSRYSIFTGIPALMGWDGHVSEWVGTREAERIRLRRSATEEILETTDRDRAKRLMDAYGVRLVVVGPLERGLLDPQKRYPAEGLDKFEGWLPLLYKNPQVSIYYNPPPGHGAS